MLTQPAQTIGLNFTAATISDTLATDADLPNQNGWVGPQQYILMTYNIIRSFNKFTGQPDGVLDIDAPSFFGLMLRMCASIIVVFLTGGYLVVKDMT